MKTIMRVVTCSGLFVILIALSGCDRARSRAIEQDEGNTSAESNRNYKDMLARMREKQTSQQAVDILEDGIQRFQVEFGRLPTNLNEMVARGSLPQLPEPPPGTFIRYDPVHGNIDLAEKPDRSDIRLPAELTNVAPLELQQVPLPGEP